MCKRYSRRHETPALAAEGPYEGQTVQLDARQTEWTAEAHSQRCGRHGGRFPWWTLWLLWPLGAMLRHATPLVNDATTALRTDFATLPNIATALAAVLLIVAGLWLIMRDRD